MIVFINSTNRKSQRINSLIQKTYACETARIRLAADPDRQGLFWIKLQTIDQKMDKISHFIIIIILDKREE